MPEPDTMDTVTAALGLDIQVDDVGGRLVENLENLGTEVTLVHNSPQCVSVSPIPDSMPDAMKPASVTTSKRSTAKGTSYKQGPRRSFTTEFKLECVEHAERIRNKTKTARVFNVNRRRVQEWCMQKEKLMAIPKQQKRLSGGGRRQAAIDAQGVQEGSKALLMDAIMSGTVSDPEVYSSTKTSESEIGAPQIFSVHNADHSLMDNIVQSLSASDPTILSANMIKMIQDLSTEVTSHVTRASFESILRDTSMEMLLQKNTDSSSSVTGEGEDSQTIKMNSVAQDISLQQDGVAQGTPLQRDGTTQDTSMDTTERDDQEVGPINNLAADTEDTTQLVQSPPLVHENSLDLSVQTAILDALMHVAVATSVQMATSEQPRISATPVTIAGTNLETSVSNSVKERLLSSNGQSPLPAGNSPTFSSNKVKKFYTVEFKLECVAHAESTSKCAAARQFNVDRRRVQDWCSQKEKLKQIVNRQTTVFGSDKKPMDDDVEKQLVAWIKLQQETGKHLTRKMVADEAVRLYREMGNLTFSANVGWVARFMIRNGICLVTSSLSKQASASLVSASVVTGNTTSAGELQ